MAAMLERDELIDTSAVFGVGDDQVLRDHLISHMLAAVSKLGVPVVFFGGTALARTYLSDPGTGARLSEDIDLYTSDRKQVAAVLDEKLPVLLRREFPRSRWDLTLSAVRSADPAQLLTADGIRVRVQLLDSHGEHRDYAAWPIEETDVLLRYRDLPATVRLRVPTIEAFAAMKTAAWVDRRAARDLYDLAGLARRGALTQSVAELIKKASGIAVAPEHFPVRPSWAGRHS
jgi:predicted nucleotidyltransferase component of viral defense system